MTDRRRVPPDEVATPAPIRAIPALGDVLSVAAGGAVGALARVALASAFPARPGQLPWMTLVENVTGAFALGLVLTVLAERFRTAHRTRLTVCTGALGAFTTYSALADEVARRLLAGHVLLGVGYGVLSVALGLVAALAGVEVARKVTQPRRPGARP